MKFWICIDAITIHCYGCIVLLYMNKFPAICYCSLTHLPLDKMAAILADDNFKGIFLNENDRIPIRIS